MIVHHFCCCLKIQAGCLFISILTMLSSASLLLVHYFAMGHTFYIDLLLALIASIILVTGSLVESVTLLISYLGVTIVVWFIRLGVIVMETVILISGGTVGSTNNFIITTSLNSVLMLLDIYFMIIVYSFIQILRNEKFCQLLEERAKAEKKRQEFRRRVKLEKSSSENRRYRKESRRDEKGSRRNRRRSRTPTPPGEVEVNLRDGQKYNVYSA